MVADDTVGDVLEGWMLMLRVLFVLEPMCMLWCHGYWCVQL